MEGSQGSQDIESVTTAVQHQAQPDNKTRRYDRQLRLWAATGQSALESARLLVISASATSTSLLKNLVLPGIGYFTILDPSTVSPADAGNNFFLEGHASISKNRAEEAVRLLAELNDGVEGTADTRSLEEVLERDENYLTEFTLVIAHNLAAPLLEKLSALLWADPSYPPLMVVRSAGFLAEFFVQFHEHTVIESHSETAPSLRIDKPFPALLEHAMSLDFATMDPTEHGHIPFVVILVRAMEDWKKANGGTPPTSYDAKQSFKNYILSMKVKPDEENFDEAHAQAYRAWTPTNVPSDIASLFQDPSLSALSSSPAPSPASSAPFFYLLDALHRFTLTADPGGVLPLTSTLPDMKASTEAYVGLQRLYKGRAEEEREVFRELVRGGLVGGGREVDGQGRERVDDAMVDLFVRNAHGLKVLRGTRWGTLDGDKVALAHALSSNPKETSTHLAFSALSALLTKSPQGSQDPQDAAATAITVEALTGEALALLGPGVELPEEFENAVGEIARAPTADLPNTAAFLGGLVAQEAIKMITKQYVPVKGYCEVDLVDSWTGIVG